jgi:hypothetical protein
VRRYRVAIETKLTQVSVTVRENSLVLPREKYPLPLLAHLLYQGVRWNRRAVSLPLPTSGYPLPTFFLTLHKSCWQQISAIHLTNINVWLLEDQLSLLKILNRRISLGANARQLLRKMRVRHRRAGRGVGGGVPLPQSGHQGNRC